MNHPWIKIGILYLCAALLFFGCASDMDKSEKFIQQGQDYYEQGEYNKAVIQLKNAVSLNPQSAEGFALLAKAYLQLGDAQKGFQNLLRQENITPDDLDLVAQVASFYLLARQPEEARRRMDRVLNENPRHIPSLFLKAGLLGQVSQRLSRETLEEIGQVYEAILEIDAKQTRAHLALARAKAGLRDFDGAESHLKQAVALEPDNNANYQTLFNFYRAQRNLEAAEQVIRDLIDRKPEEADPHIYMGNYHLSRRDVEKAKSEFTIAMEKDPKSLNPYMKLAQIANLEKDYERAEALLEKAVAINPENFAVKTAQADFYFTKGKIGQAQAILDQIMEVRPDFLPAKILQGKLMAQIQQLDEAIDIFRTLVQEEPNSPNFNYLLGKALAQNGEQAQANAAISKAIELNPNFIPARMLMAQNQFIAGDLYVAETHVNRVLNIQPTHYNATVLLGNIRLANKEYTQARELYQKLIDGAPQIPVAYYRMGILDQVEKKYDQAISHFDKALALNPNLMDVFAAKVRLKISLKEYAAALSLCEEQLAQTDVSPVVVSVTQDLKGNIYLAQNQLEKAKAAYEKAIKSNPKFIPPYSTLARILMSQGLEDDTIDLYTRLSVQLPKQASPESLIGTIYEQRGELDKAEIHYKKALDRDPDHIASLNNLAFIYAEQNRELDLALDMARRARLQAGENAAIMDTLGWVYYKKALYDSAVQEFKACVAKVPGNPIFHFHLGLAYDKLGRRDQAVAALGQALKLQENFPGAELARTILNQG